MVRHAGAAATQQRTHIKILNGPAMRCDAEGCARKAGYLFRSGGGPIEALCDVHAAESASRIGAKLPERAVHVLRMGFTSAAV